ncbi:ABC transporter substrate-binding protein [Streptomyces sp. MZ04]|uniref:ABC transporter substrate-binding protein n=1 Tax=Streptomyces sp. MZ04 TaxID=2559236 RepID=UPI00107EB149|nr:ABC transporter substrate-binding protein [Streptomyces sp. MZ04]TGB14546.1 carbohydrate ABC transporter substrate-binding protein [Streptomyces sp. MZ04]
MPENGTKWSCVTVAVLTLSALLTGCGGSDESSGGGRAVLRYTWWGNPDRAARTQEAVALFEKEHPGVEVQTSFAGYEAYKQKLATQAAGGDAPDVMQLDYRQIDQYAIPQGRGTETVVYDSEQWKAAGVPLPRKGWTWGEWAYVMRELAKKTGKPGSVDPGQSEDCFEVWLRGRGKSLYTKDRGLGFTAADLTRWWTFTDELRRAGAVSSAEQTTQLDGSVENQPLARGNAISDFNWDAPASGYTPIVGEGLTLAPMPSGTGGTPGQYFKPSMFMGAADSTEHPKEAAQFIDFMINDEQAAAILGASRGIPVNEPIREDIGPELKDFDKTVADYQDSLDGTLKALPKAPPTGDNSLQTTFQRDYDQVSFEQMTPREAAEDFITEAKAELRS